jgi:hypothetical protein
VRKWLIVVLSLTWLAWELIAAFDSNSHTWPLTRVIVAYVPWPVTALAIAVLIAWLPLHFAAAYRNRNASGEALAAEPVRSPPTDAPAEPLLTIGTVTSAVVALLGLFAAFGLKLSDHQQSVVLGVVAVIVPVVVAVIARRKVFSPATVAKMLPVRGAAR